jgi:hypothetical protein
MRYDCKREAEFIEALREILGLPPIESSTISRCKRAKNAQKKEKDKCQQQSNPAR